MAFGPDVDDTVEVEQRGVVPVGQGSGAAVGKRRHEDGPLPTAGHGQACPHASESAPCWRNRSVARASRSAWS